MAPRKRSTEQRVGEREGEGKSGIISAGNWMKHRRGIILPISLKTLYAEVCSIWGTIATLEQCAEMHRFCLDFHYPPTNELHDMGCDKVLLRMGDGDPSPRNYREKFYLQLSLFPSSPPLKDAPVGREEPLRPPGASASPRYCGQTPVNGCHHLWDHKLI